MHYPMQPPPERGPRELRALRVSLNAPVVSIDGLAIGPAHAAIAVPAAGSAPATLWLALRSQRSGQVVCFGPDEPLDSEAGLRIALDGALSFAESMGFLFDDDPIEGLGPDGPQQAARLWNDLLGIEPAEPMAAPLAAAAPGDAVDALETDGDGVPESPLEVDALPTEEAAAGELWLEELAPVAPAPPVLTKFRRSARPGQKARRNGWPIRLLSHF
jgi:hypothetical protein